MAPLPRPTAFEEEDEQDDGWRFAHFARREGGPALPPVTFKVEEIADNASPQEILRGAMEDRAVESTLEPDTSFGPVVIPAEKTLWGYKYVLSHGTHDIAFSPETYPVFDAVIAAECGDAHPAFTRGEYGLHYAPLRRNLAILRNHLMALYPPKANQALLKGLAEKLGKALRVEQQKLGFIQRLLNMLLKKSTPGPDAINPFLALANTPDRGIAFMYEFLRIQQARTLPPLEASPFSAENMVLYSDATRMGKIARAFDLVARNLRSVDEMTVDDKEISVDHARDILKNLRIIMTGAAEEKQYDEMDPRCRDAQTMLQSALGFQAALARMAKGEPDILNDPLVLEASKAIVRLSARVNQEEKTMQKQEDRAPTTTQQQPQQQSSGKSSQRPERQKPKESINKIMFKFEDGINRVSEIRRSRLARGRQASVMGQALSQQKGLQSSLNEGMSTMSRPKIHQVSVDDPLLIEEVRKANEDRAAEAQKTNPGGRNVGGK